jgi:hypothetical protein
MMTIYGKRAGFPVVKASVAFYFVRALTHARSMSNRRGERERERASSNGSDRDRGERMRARPNVI